MAPARQLTRGQKRPTHRHRDLRFRAQISQYGFISITDAVLSTFPTVFLRIYVEERMHLSSYLRNNHRRGRVRAFTRRRSSCLCRRRQHFFGLPFDFGIISGPNAFSAGPLLVICVEPPWCHCGDDVSIALRRPGWRRDTEGATFGCPRASQTTLFSPISGGSISIVARSQF